MSPSFLVIAEYYHKDGVEMRIVKRYNLSPEQQRDALNACIVGYDPHHPDGPDTALFKFAIPTVPKPG